jgi:hypothetical protein
MHILAVSLLTILAGTLLLAKVKKDGLGKLFTYISWFFVIVGFLLFLGAIGFGVCRMSNCCKSGNSECRQEMMMKGCQPGMVKHGMHEGMCRPHDDCKGPCGPKPGCMKNDSTMKCCPGHMKGDSAKALPAKPD